MILAFLLSLHISQTVRAAPSEDTSASTESARIEAEFLSGLTDLKKGNTQGAIKKFSAILAIDPNLVRVRLEYGLAYFMARQWDRARNEFFKALSSNLPDPVRSKVLGLIREIDARRGFNWDLGIGVTDVGNQRNYDTDRILLDFAGLNLPFTLNRKKSSEAGVRARGAANFRRPVDFKVLGDDTYAFGAVSFDITEARTSQYDDYVFVGRFGLRTLVANTTASIGPVVTSRLIGGNVFENRVGLESALERRSLQGGSVSGFLSGAKLYNPTSALLDGREVDAEIKYRRSIGGRGLIGISAFFEDKSVEDALENFLRRRLTIFGQADAHGGFTLRPTIYVEQKRFKTPSILFTGNPDETSWGGSLRIEKNDVFLGNGFSPFLFVSYQRTRSGIDAFSYSETGFEFGLERRF